MTSDRRSKLIPMALAVLALALALIQRPGTIVAETKVNLDVSPVRFLGDVVSAWTPTGSLGHVWSGQYGGYLFPMAPFFALGHLVGLSPWLIDRLWLGGALAVAACGVVWLVDELFSPNRGAAHAVAGSMYLLNPYVVTYANRTSVALLGYAALPWLLVGVRRGLRDPRGWTWPALLALVVTTSGGGVNAAVTAWILVGPALLVIYERVWGAVDSAALRSFLVRAVAVIALASLWWVVGVLVNGAYGVDFLAFTEQPGSIWRPSSLPESLRLMGFWTSYLGIGYGGTLRPFTADSGVMLFQPLVVGASLLVPALALGSFAWTRRRPYAPFLLAMVLLGLIIMTAGFPDGTPLRRGLDFTYFHFAPVRFLRTTYKAGPLVALGLAGLGGLAAGGVAGRRRRVDAGRGGHRWGLGRAWRRSRLGVNPKRSVAVLAGLTAVSLLALSAWPLVRGRALDGQLAFDRVPAGWRSAARDLDRHHPPGSRAMLLPGQLFGFYRWGGTVDEILPALTSFPVAARYVVPYADPRATQLQWSVDALVNQQRALPGQLRALLGLLGVGAVINATDVDRTRGDAINAPEASTVLAEQGLGRPTRAYGPVSAAAPSAGSLESPARLPELRRWDIRGAPMVQLLPRGPMTILDGGAGGLLDLAAFGALPAKRPIAYAPDLSHAQLGVLARDGADLVISDSNRRQLFVSSRLRTNLGPTLAPDDPVAPDGAVLDPFPAHGTDAQTVALLRGVAYVRAPTSPGSPQFPEHRGFAALDGNPTTAWLASRYLDVGRRYLEVGLRRPLDVPYVDLLPHGDSRGHVRAVAVNGKGFDVHDGWNRLAAGLHHVSALRIALTSVTHPAHLHGGAGGISELRIPGVRARESLRPPVLLEHAVAGVDLSRSRLTYLFERTTGADPFRRQPLVGAIQAGLRRDTGDAELGLARSFAPPAPRRWIADAWVTAGPANDGLLDRLAGYRGPDAFESSSRFGGVPGYRASRAFDGDPSSAWIGEWLPGHPAWLAWSTRHPMLVRSLVLVAPRVIVRRPTVVSLRYPGGVTPPLAVGPGGVVHLPRPIQAARLRLDILDARFPSGTAGAIRQRRAVGIAEVRGISGLPPAGIPRRGSLHGSCALTKFTLGGRHLGLAVRGTVAQLDAGRPLAAHACGAPLDLPRHPLELRGGEGPLRVYALRLTSRAPAHWATAPGPPSARRAPFQSGAGGILEPGSGGRGAWSGVRLAPHGPSWLVLSQAYDRGWRAYCQGHSLGAPQPLQGYANGWPVGAECRTVSFRFAPDRWMLVADTISGLAAVLCLGTLLVARRRGRAARAPDAVALVPASDPAPAPWPLRQAIRAGLIAAAGIGFVFSLRAGAVAGPVIALLLWRGARPRSLALAAGLILAVAVPAVYALKGAPDHGGYNTEYAVELIAAHWVALGAFLLLALSLWHTLAARRGS